MRSGTFALALLVCAALAPRAAHAGDGDEILGLLQRMNNALGNGHGAAATPSAAAPSAARDRPKPRPETPNTVYILRPGKTTLAPFEGKVPPGWTIEHFFSHSLVIPSADPKPYLQAWLGDRNPHVRGTAQLMLGHMLSPQNVEAYRKEGALPREFLAIKAYLARQLKHPPSKTKARAAQEMLRVIGEAEARVATPSFWGRVGRLFRSRTPRAPRRAALRGR